MRSARHVFGNVFETVLGMDEDAAAYKHAAPEARRQVSPCWKASNAKPEAWESWQVEIERRRCGTFCNLIPL